MNILFLSLVKIKNVNRRNLYSDLIREMESRGHNVYVVSPIERRLKERTELIDSGKIKVLRIKTLNIQKTNLIEKGLGTFLIEHQFYSGIKKYYKGIRFDAVLYATPPITLIKPIQYIKKRDNAKTYLMLKDIFPQNAIDLGMMTTSGLKGIVYRIFKKKEQKLYEISDHIGCMSQANVDYFKQHNSQIDESRISISPNAVDPLDLRVNYEEKQMRRRKYGIPENRMVFIFGGNLGKPQGVSFLLECLKKEKSNSKAYFLIVGNGTEYGKIESAIKNERLSNVRLISKMEKEEYDLLVPACDVGMIFLDHRFTIPNFPSRLLEYTQAGIPILACTDPNTDIGKVITDGGFGWWCESNDVNAFHACLEKACSSNLKELGDAGYQHLKKHYSVKESCDEILKSLE